uniref:Uncharacterized protein n=1 Tax=Oryza glumipatula TaxID=40148 RepID=A0A0D9ZSX3_9ORYZ
MAIFPAGPVPWAGGIFHPRVHRGRGPAFGRGGDGGTFHPRPPSPLPSSPVSPPASSLTSPVPSTALAQGHGGAQGAAAAHRAAGRGGEARQARARRGDGRGRRGCSTQARWRPAIHVSNTPKYSRRFTGERYYSLRVPAGVGSGWDFSPASMVGAGAG